MKSSTQPVCRKNLRAKILEAASEVFMQYGYRGSIDLIAKRAGVARMTIYHHFKCKDELFITMIECKASLVTVTLDGVTENLRDKLIFFGSTLRELALTRESIEMLRVLISEAPKFPELAQTTYRTGQGALKKQLVLLIDHAMQTGQLQTDDPAFAAEMLISMLIYEDRTANLFCIKNCELPNVDKSARIIDLFLNAFAPNKASNSR